MRIGLIIGRDKIMDNAILITQLNDFIFCPASIYFHMLYGDTDRMLYQSEKQINGTSAHETVDNNTYSKEKHVLSGVDVYCEKYNLIGKIDIYDMEKYKLVERKRTVKNIYDGYVFQVYAQYFALIEMGYRIDSIVIHSVTDNKNYDILLPEKDTDMLNKFEKTIYDIKNFDISNYEQPNKLKCKNCIYEPACDRGGVLDDE